MGAQRIERSGLRSETIPIGFAVAPACVRDAPPCCPMPASVAGDETAPPVISAGTVAGAAGMTIVLVPPAASVVPIAGEALAAGDGVAVAPRTSAIACAVTLSGSREACSVLLVLSRTRRATFLPLPPNIIHSPAPVAINIRKKIAAPMSRFRPRPARRSSASALSFSSSSSLPEQSIRSGSNNAHKEIKATNNICPAHRCSR